MLLSIIVPIYNTEKYLPKCIDSLLSQSFDDFEVILVDDGSTDASGEICDAYAAKEKVRVLHQSNQGAVCARQNGLKLARGQYVTYVDSDDWIDADLYRNMLAKGTANHCDAMIGSMVIDRGQERLPCENYMEAGLYTKERLKQSFYGKMLFDKRLQCPAIKPSLCNKIFKRDILETVMSAMDPVVTFGEDVMCSYPCLLDCERVYVLNEQTYYHYVQHSQSMTHSYDPKLLERFLALGESLKTEFAKRGFDDGGQLDCYIAQYSLECIRKELLYNRKTRVRQRVKTVKAYLMQPLIIAAFGCYAKKVVGKNAFKVALINSGRVFLLYLLIKLRSLFLRVATEG